MPYAETKHARLYYEETGKGTPIVFVHEFSGDLRSWESQLRHFSRRHRCIAFNARGYPPSSVPGSWKHYSQTLATDDIAAVMRHLGLRKAHIIGCSMGAMATLHFGLRYPRMAQSLTLVGAGSGSSAGNRRQYLRDTEARARAFESQPMQEVARLYRRAANRVQLLHKDLRTWNEFWARFAEQSGPGHANTLRGIQAQSANAQAIPPAMAGSHRRRMDPMRDRDQHAAPKAFRRTSQRTGARRGRPISPSSEGAQPRIRNRRSREAPVPTAGERLQPSRTEGRQDSRQAPR